MELNATKYHYHPESVIDRTPSSKSRSISIPVNLRFANNGLKKKKLLPNSCKGKVLKVMHLNGGINHRHKCFQNAQIIIKNFTEDASMVDEDGYSTYCSSLLVGSETNFFQGLTPKAILYSAKVVSNQKADNQNIEVKIVKALNWAVSLDVDLVLFTFGLNVYSPTVGQSINKAIKNNMTVIASAGSTDKLYPNFPSIMPSVWCVSTMKKNNQVMPGEYNNVLVDVYVEASSIVGAFHNNYSIIGGSNPAAALFCGYIGSSLSLK